MANNTSGSPAANSEMVVGRKPAPVGHCERPFQWLSTCIQTHKKCALYQTLVSNERSFPTRVLDLGKSDEPERVRLIPGAGLKGKYVALSHCWGNTSVVQTTKASYSSFMNSIDPRNLNKTFQDAINITRNLGIQYLWIDSLCIIQDDPKDWEIEAASMAQVYSQAYLTIAASAAADGSQGLLRKDPRQPYIKLPNPSKSESLNYGVSIGPALSRFYVLDSAPLNTRAWTLQERVLSSRTLHYAADQVHWECRELLSSEARNPPYGRGLDHSTEDSFHAGWLARISEDLLPIPGAINDSKHEYGSAVEDKLYFADENDYPRSNHDSWYGMVQVYTQRHLSRELDKLPALSGLANAYSKRHKGEYVGGLWSQDIVNGLLWYSRTSEPLQRPSNYRAPSWSWASVDGPVDFFTINAGIVKPYVEVEDVEAWIELEGTDPYGRIKNGALSLRGAVREAYIETIEEEDSYEGSRMSVQILFDDISAIGSITMDFPIPDGKVYCLLVASAYMSQSTKMDNNVVMLLESTGNENEFRRVGYSVFFNKRDYTPNWTLRPTPESRKTNSEVISGNDVEDELEYWFDGIEKEKIIII